MHVKYGALWDSRNFYRLDNGDCVRRVKMDCEKYSGLRATMPRWNKKGNSCDTECLDVRIDGGYSSCLSAFSSACRPSFLCRYFLLNAVMAKASPIAMGTKIAEARFTFLSQPSSANPLKT